MQINKEAGATKGIVEVAAGNADIGGTCRHVIVRDEEKGVELVPVAWDALIVITNKSNPVSNLTLEQIKNIFTGKIANWKDVGGPNQPIQVVAREGKISGVGRMARELIFKNPNQDFTPNAKLFKSSSHIEDFVEKTPWAIAFTGVSSMPKGNFKTMNIEGKEPSYSKIASGEYILYRPLYLVIRQKADPEIKKFISFEIMHKMAQEVANSTAEQKRGGDSVVKAMEGISHISSENLKLSTEMKAGANEALLEVEKLQNAVKRFKLN